MKALMVLVFLSACLAAPARAAEAGPRPGAVVFGAGVVYYVPGDGSGRWGPSALARYLFSDRLGVEGAAHYVNESYADDVDVHTGAGQLSLLGLLGRGMFRVEPLAGVGYYGSRVEGPNFHRNLGRFAVHAGANAEAWLGKDRVWSVIAGWRHVWLSDLDVGSTRRERAGEQLNFGVSRVFGTLSR